MGGALSITALPQNASTLSYHLPKSRVTFVLLGIFGGAFGVHNFYAGYGQRGGFQLALTLVSCFYLSLITWPWALVEICLVSRDAEDQLMT